MPTLPVPDSRDPDVLLDAWLTWVDGQGLEPYPAQEEAVLELFAGRNVILNTPTGSGKSLVAVAAHLRAIARGERSWYTSPIKALVSEKFFDLCETFGAENVGMITGDGSVNPGAPLICCTAEILAKHALREGRDADVQSVVMDEFHYYADPARGTAWQVPLLLLEEATFLLMSATLGDTTAIAEQLQARTGRTTIVVRGAQRPVPLEYRFATTPLLETLAGLLGGQAPVYIVAFTQREATELAQGLVSDPPADKEARKALREAMSGFKFDTPFGKKLRRCVEHGIGIHHAGLLPRYRRLVEKLAQQGQLPVICGTDTLGVGVNVPIRTVLFTRLYKFDGQKSALLSVRDFQQIAGRAGRRGYDDRGYVVAQAPAHELANKRLENKVAAGLLKKNKVVREPPPRGFVPYDEASFARLHGGQAEPLAPVFTVDHGMLLELMQQQPGDATVGFRALQDLIRRCHLPPAQQDKLLAHADHLRATLLDAGVVVPTAGGEALADHLQGDFSVFHSLALFALHAIGQLDEADPACPLRVLAVVESILENPTPILNAMRSKARGEAVAQMKAEGLDYEERMAALESVDYPKPEAEWLYRTFNDYAAERPWLSAEHVRPKGVVRALFETWSGFAQFVRDLGVEAVEGVLLRYLAEVWRVLDRTVPEPARSEPLLEMTAFLRATIAHADSSLLAEWEAMLHPTEETAPAVGFDRRAFAARVRAEVHQLVRALAQGDWEDAASALCDPEGAWPPERLEAETLALLDGDVLRFDHAARLADKTSLQPDGPQRWVVRQVLLGADEPIGGLALRVDLSSGAPEGPAIRLESIG